MTNVTRMFLGLNFFLIVPEVLEKRSIFWIDFNLHKHRFCICRKVEDVFPETDYDTSKVVQKTRPDKKVRIQGVAKKNTGCIRHAANFARFVVVCKQTENKHPQG